MRCPLCTFIDTFRALRRPTTTQQKRAKRTVEIDRPFRQWISVGGRLYFYRSLSSMSNRFRPSRFRRGLRHGLLRRARVQALRRHTLARGRLKSALPALLNAALLRPAMLGKGLPTTRRGRLVWLLTPIVLISLAWLIVWRVARPSVDVEAQVRRQALPALAQALGMPVEIGRIDSDYLSRVVLHDVVGGRDASSPIGANFRARRVTLGLNILALVRGSDALGALRSINIEAPEAWLERDASGKTNWDSLLNQRGPASKWTGRVTIHGGRALVRDAMTRNSRGEPLSAEAAPVEAVLDVAPDETAFRVTSDGVIGNLRAPLRGIALDGRFSGGDGKTKAWLASGARWGFAPLAVLADYAFPRRDIVVTAGVASGAAQISYDAALAPREQWMASGALQIDGAGGWVNALREPASRRPLVVNALSGPLEFSNRAVRSEGLSLVALGSPLRVSGTAALPESGTKVSALPPAGTRNSTVLQNAVFNALVESNAFNVNRVLSAVRPILPRNVDVQSGVAQVAVRVTGTLQTARAKGRFASASLAVRRPEGSASVVAPRGTFAYDIQTQRTSGSLQAASLQGAASRFGAASAVRPNLAFALDPKANRASGTLVAASLRAGQKADALSAVAPNVVWALDNRTARATGRFAATQVSAQIGRDNARARSFSSDFVVDTDPRNSQVRAAFSAGGWNARVAQPNATANGKESRGVFFWSGQGNRFALRMTAANAEGRSPQVGLVRGRVRALVVRGSQRGNAMPLAISALLDNWAARGVGRNDFGATEGRSLQLVASAPDANRGAWRGRADVRGVDASAIRLAALPPNVVQALRDTQISNLGRADFVVEFQPRGNRVRGLNDLLLQGDVRLSSARVGGEYVRDVIARARFDAGRWQIDGIQAQSAYGPLVATVSTAGGVPAFSISAARVAIPAALLNTVLAPQGLLWEGSATGRVQASGSIQATRIRLDISTARGMLRERVGGRPIARLENATLRAQGILRSPRTRTTIAPFALYDGTLAISAARILAGSESMRVPLAIRGAALRDVRSTVSGQLDVRRLLASTFTGDVRFSRASLRLPQEVRSNSTVLGDGSARFSNSARGLEISRFALRAFPETGAVADASRVRGSASLRTSGAWAAQILTERFDAARLQRLLAPIARVAPEFKGSTFARVNLSGTTADVKSTRVGVDARVLNGAVALAGRVVPFDSARVSVALEGLDTLTVRDGAVWSRGGRLAFNGTVRPVAQGRGEGSDGNDYALDISVRANDLRLRDAAALTASKTPADGLASGEFRIGGTLALPRIDGRGALRLAAFAGIPLDEATARVSYESTPDGPRFAIRDIAGRSGEAKLAGRFIGDAPADQWRFALATQGIETSRALRASGRELAADPTNLRSAPLQGTLQADIDVRGKFGENFVLVPLEGGAQVKASTLRWRGRDLGALEADLSLDGKTLRINEIALHDTANSATSPSLRITGTTPLEAEASGLDLRVEARRAPLELGRTALEEVRQTLRDNGTRTGIIDTVLRGWNNLPGRLQGEANLDAHVTGSIVSPVADIEASIKDATLGTQKLPVLQAALRVENDAAIIRSLELKQVEAARAGDEDDEPRETVLRLEEGGRISPQEISLDGELLGANLSQLAPWVAALRNESGAPLLQGEVALFNFQIRGTPASPSVSGSLEAQKLSVRDYTLDRLRFARFQIENGQFSVAPGNLTVVKGGFQSSAAWGRVPWDWTRGIDPEGPVEIHLPVQTSDFGALAGVLVPALREVNAEAFDGTLDIGGTFAQPQLAGELAMRRVRFATEAVSGLDFGVRELSGTVRFAPGNILQLDNLRGELANASQVEGTKTGNLPAAERANRNTVEKGLSASGTFALNGTIGLKFDAANFVSPARFVAAQRYDLSFNVSKGTFSRRDISGVRDLSLDLAWKTGTGAEETAQRVSWQFAGAGVKGSANKRQESGRVRSAGSAQLNLENIARTRWDGTLQLNAFGFDVTNVARGQLNGDLQFVQLPLVRSAPLLARATLEKRLSLARAVATEPKGTVEIDRTSVQTRSSAAQLPGNTPLASGTLVPGIRGSLELVETELIGAPVGTVGVASLLPDAPAFDIKFLVGRNVRFLSPTLRADFAGGLQISGTPRDPLVIGTLTARDGQIRFPAANARIVTAEVDVNVARDESGLVRSSAIIDATARGQAGRYAITLTVRGPLDFGSNNVQQLRIEVSSNPPLSEDEAFARLTGTSIRDLQANNAPNNQVNEAYASAFLSVLSAPLFSGIERSLEEVLGLSSITLDYRLSEPLSVQFGKAIGDRVYVSYRRDITGSRPGEPTRYELRVDYRIKGDFQLGLQTDERNRRAITLEKTFRF
jgi:hypothetical protein